MPPSDHGLAQLAGRCEAAIFHRDDHRLFSIERSAYLASVTVAQPEARRAARYEPPIMEAGDNSACNVGVGVPRFRPAISGLLYCGNNWCR
jgi:hypothetical protein